MPAQVSLTAGYSFLSSKICEKQNTGKMLQWPFFSCKIIPHLLPKVSFEIAFIFPLENTKIGNKSIQDPSRSLEWLWKQRLAGMLVCSMNWAKWFLPPWLIFLSALAMGPKLRMKQHLDIYFIKKYNNIKNNVLYFFNIDNFLGTYLDTFRKVIQMRHNNLVCPIAAEFCVGL